jgi:thiamine-phosphate pyrophosphorylase
VSWDLSSRNLYLCTPDREDIFEFVRGCIEGGVDLVQLREKSATDKRIVEQAAALTKLCSDLGVPFLVNDRPDIALDSGADGVHLGQDDVSAGIARRLLGDDAIVGLSTHAEPELLASVAEPVDYVSAGPVVPTPTKPGRAGTGFDYVTFAVKHAQRPVFITGGASPETIPEIAAAGARHFVVVRYLTEADDPKLAARRLREAVDRALEAG